MFADVGGGGDGARQIGTLHTRLAGIGMAAAEDRTIRFGGSR